jgi:hypothetical protein
LNPLGKHIQRNHQGLLPTSFLSQESKTETESELIEGGTGVFYQVARVALPNDFADGADLFSL